MAQGVSGWFAKVLEAKARAGKPVNVAELARVTQIDRTILQRLKAGRIQSTSQEYVDRIAKALEVPAPRVGEVVATGGVSAATMATLASVRADLENAVKQIRSVERDLTRGDGPTPSGVDATFRRASEEMGEAKRTAPPAGRALRRKDG